MKVEILEKEVNMTPLGGITSLTVGLNGRRFRAYYDIEVEPKTGKIVSIAVSMEPLEPVKLYELRNSE